MKYTLSALAVCLSLLTKAQLSYVDLHTGTGHYNGDLQTKRFHLNQAQIALGAGISYTITPKWSIRGAANYIRLYGADVVPISNKAGSIRNLSFKTSVFEVQLAAEYHLFNIKERGFSPYVFAGIAAFQYNPYAYDSMGNKVFLRSLGTEGQGLSAYPEKKLYNTNQFAIPFGGGIKLALSHRLHLSIEVGLRKLFTDYLDDVSGTYADSNRLADARGPQSAAFAFRGRELYPNTPYPAAGSIRGNPKNKDWYFTTGIRFSYQIGGGNNRIGLRKRGSQLGCPSIIY
jgi:opacity protein-like surface antigen